MKIFAYARENRRLRETLAAAKEDQARSLSELRKLQGFVKYLAAEMDVDQNEEVRAHPELRMPALVKLITSLKGRAERAEDSNKDLGDLVKFMQQNIRAPGTPNTICVMTDSTELAMQLATKFLTAQMAIGVEPSALVKHYWDH